MTRPNADSEFERFLAELDHSSDPHISPTRYASVLRMSHGQLAELADVHGSTVGRRPHSPDLQNFVRASVDVLIAATKRRGDHRGILFWFRNAPIPTFQHLTAETVVSQGRAEELLRYIETIEAGTAPITCTLLRKTREV